MRKKKDILQYINPQYFWDINFALDDKRYVLNDMVDFYRKKYGQEGDMHVIKGLVYFDDVDLSDWPVLLRKTNLEWTEVKNRINTEVKEYISSFNSQL